MPRRLTNQPVNLVVGIFQKSSTDCKYFRSDKSVIKVMLHKTVFNDDFERNIVVLKIVIVIV